MASLTWPLHRVHAWHLVTQPLGFQYLGDAVLITGREQCSNHVEYLRAGAGELGLFLMVGDCGPRSARRRPTSLLRLRVSSGRRLWGLACIFRDLSSVA